MTRFSNFILAISTLVGTIIGVGMFGLPYAASRSGVAVALAYLLVLGLVVTCLHLIYGEIVLRTSQRHRLAGYAQVYLGRGGKLAASLIFFVTLYLALWVYLLVGGEFLSAAFSGWLDFSARVGSLILAGLGFFVVFKGVRLAGVFEFLMTLVLLALIMGLLIYGGNFVAKENWTWPPADISGWFLPYGVVLFALAGGSAVPEIRSLFRAGQASVLKKAIVWGTWLPVAVYAVFILAVVGISGGATSTEAIKGLSPFLGANVVKYGAAIGFLAIITSFFTVGLNIKNSFRFDFGLSSGLSFILTAAVPLVLFWLGWRDFIKIISVGGAVLGGLEGLLLLAIWRKAKRKGDRAPEYQLKLRPILVCLIALVFVVGIVYEIVYSF
ncbi:MAG: hypothetical protein HY454_03665 [Parcubacteria group bacterium]|nr:hypothetical protein [Parcubacteria group bacterium]